MTDATADALFGGQLPKGDALASIRLAGIMGAKRTPDLIPLCHPILIDGVTVSVERIDPGARIVATVTTSGRTGVEMEAMTAVTVAALALYDMVKVLSAEWSSAGFACSTRREGALVSGMPGTSEDPWKNHPLDSGVARSVANLTSSCIEH